jgi:hypothetical protein
MRKHILLATLAGLCVAGITACQEKSEKTNTPTATSEASPTVQPTTFTPEPQLSVGATADNTATMPQSPATGSMDNNTNNTAPTAPESADAMPQAPAAPDVTPSADNSSPSPMAPATMQPPTSNLMTVPPSTSPAPTASSSMPATPTIPAQ